MAEQLSSVGEIKKHMPGRFNANASKGVKAIYQFDLTGDGGETFRLTQQDDRKGLSAVLPGPAGKVIVAGEGGVRTLPIASQAP